MTARRQKKKLFEVKVWRIAGGAGFSFFIYLFFEGVIMVNATLVQHTGGSSSVWLLLLASWWITDSITGRQTSLQRSSRQLSKEQCVSRRANELSQHFCSTRNTHTRIQRRMPEIQGINFSVFIILLRNVLDISVNKYLHFKITFTSALAEVENKARSLGRGKLNEAFLFATRPADVQTQHGTARHRYDTNHILTLHGSQVSMRLKLCLN